MIVNRAISSLTPITGLLFVLAAPVSVLAADVKLTADEIALLEKPYQPHKILGHAQPSPKEMLGKRF